MKDEGKATPMKRLDVFLFIIHNIFLGSILLYLGQKIRLARPPM
jgi:hypothetical protein